MDASVKLREATPDNAPAIARVQVKTWRTACRGLYPDAFLTSLSVEEKSTHWRKTIERSGQDFAEVGYGWTDLRVVAKCAAP